MDNNDNIIHIISNNNDNSNDDIPNNNNIPIVCQVVYPVCQDPDVLIINHG